MVVYRLALANRGTAGLGTVIEADLLAATGVLWDSEVPLRWSRQLNGPGALEFTIPIDSPVDESDIAAGERELHLYRGDPEVLVWGGRLWTHDFAFPGIRFLAEGFYSTLRYGREMREDFVRDDEEQQDIAWDLIAYTQAKTGGGLGITRDAGETPSGVTRSVLVCAEECRNIASMIEDLASADDGFDFEVMPDKEWRVWAPRRGTDLSGTLHFNAAVNLSNLTGGKDARIVRNDVAAIGPVEECDPIHFETEVDATSRTDFGLMEGSVIRSDQVDLGLITALAREELRINKRPFRSLTVTAPEVLEGPAVVEYDVGDIVRVSAARDWVTFDEDFRVAGVRTSVSMTGSETVELELDGAV